MALLLVPGGCMMAGCSAGGGGNRAAAGGAADDGALVSEVAAKAVDVADTIGGENGYGGTMMNGYAAHAEPMMGFAGSNDLAGTGPGMMMQLRNDSDQSCMFAVHYVASAEGVDEQVAEVEVPAGETVDVPLPCSEIVGLGTLDAPGSPGCRHGDGTDVDNRMAVPGFLGMDYTCGGTYGCSLTPDVDDLDGDGDTEELILLSEGMQMHVQNGGPMGHQHGQGTGMMGMHSGAGMGMGMGGG